MKLEQTILKNLIFNDEYLRKVLPFIKAEYFSDRAEKVIFDEITKFTNDYNTSPSIESIALEIQEKKYLTDDEVSKCGSYLSEITSASSEESKTELS